MSFRVDSTKSSMPVLEARGVVKRFRGVEVLQGVDLRIDAGETVILYGHNGAGKTTLLRILATLSRPNGGVVHVAGHSLEDRASVRRFLYYSGHGTQLYDDLVPSENLKFFVGLYGKHPSDDAIREVLDTVGLWRFRHFKSANFSAGMKRRLGLARMILLRPALLLLDEPYTSLDRAGVKLVNRFLTDYAAAGGAALLASHSPELSDDLPHRSVWMYGGKLNAEAPAHVA